MNIPSVAIYMICFTLSATFCYLADCELDNPKNKKSTFIVLVLISITIPCILAACRDVSVGTDIRTYLYPDFLTAKYDNYDFARFNHLQPVQTELLFSLLVFACGKIGSLGLLMFIIEVLVLAPLYCALFKMREYNNVTLGLVLFFLLFYNFSLSGMRQSIAMSFIALAFIQLTEKKYLTAICLSLIAFNFHSSAILIAILLLGCNIVLESKYYRGWNVVLIAGLTIVFFAFSILHGPLVKIVGIVSSRYVFYLNKYMSGGGINLSDIPATDLIVKTSLVLITWIALNATNRYEKEDNKYFALCMIGRFFVLFNSVFYESMRIAFYFDLFIILFVPRIYKTIDKNRSSYALTTGILILLALTYWGFFTMHNGAYGTNYYLLR